MTIRRSSLWMLPAFALAALMSPTLAMAQGSRADYERANRLGELTRDKVFNANVDPHWSADGKRFWYRNDLPGGKHEFILVDAEKGVRQPAFDSAKLAGALSKETGKSVPADNLAIETLAFANAADTLRVKISGKWWACDLKNEYTLSEDKGGPEASATPDEQGVGRRRGGGFGFRGRLASAEGATSPDKKWSAFIKDNNVFIRESAGGREVALSKDGKPGDAYDGRFFWSPDSKKLVVTRTVPGEEHKVYFVESSPRDQVQPKLHTLNYVKPGDRISLTKPRLFDVEGGRQIPVSDELFANPWEGDGVRWEADSSRFVFLYNQRGHQVMRILAVDAASGAVKPIVNEEPKTFINYSGKFFVQYLDATREILWMSERDGWNHLYLIDAMTGSVKSQITKGEWVVRGIDQVDVEKRQIWFRAGGIRPGQNPYFIHYCRVNFDGSGLTILTEGDGTHAIRYSPDRKYILDTYSRVDMPPVNELRRVEDGKLVCALEKADWSELLKTGWKAPEPFVAKGRDGTTDIYGVIYRPVNFDPAKKYPVIEQIYAGPQDSYVPTGFRTIYQPMVMAELGFITVQIDGMGTNNRSKAFHDVCWKNLVDGGFPDRILWMKAAAAKYPYMDLSRVGIYGGSAGGQNAAGAVFTHPEFYKAAVADCGCHDNRMDKIWWNEQWMGWPVGPHYAEQSNVTLAKNLQGKLMLVVGECDENVDPASTMQVVNALIKANKDFDLLIVPGSNHGACESPYGQRRRQDFFVRNLLGVEPRHD